MKRTELIKKVKENGWQLERHGKKHDIYTNGTDEEPIPRHNEIDEYLASKILKRTGLQ